MKNFLIRHWLILLILFLTAAVTVYWFSWHLKPFTPNAFVFADTRPVSPLVEGFITEIHVKNNQFVKKGQPLFTVFRENWRLKTETLENDLRAEQSGLRALQAEMHSAESEIRVRLAELANDRYLSERAGRMYRSEAVSQAYTEERLRAQQASEARTEAVKYKVEALKHQCARSEARIAALTRQLELCRIMLDLTIVRAMNDGYVTSLTISPGGYYKPGDVLCGFIDSGHWHVQANFKESELSEISAGMSARIWLRQYPGHIYRGVVEHTGWGVERREMSRDTGISRVRKENEWFLLPQRFPVQILILNPDRNLQLHHGGSAYVEVDTPSRPIRQFFWELFL